MLTFNRTNLRRANLPQRLQTNDKDETAEFFSVELLRWGSGKQKQNSCANIL
jgi:hypothetical protein